MGPSVPDRGSVNRLGLLSAPSCLAERSDELGLLFLI